MVVVVSFVLQMLRFNGDYEDIKDCFVGCIVLVQVCVF